MSESNSSSGGIGLGGVVFIVFLVLKLVPGNPVNQWSWWWVTCPLWGVLALGLGILLVGLAIGATGEVLGALGSWSSRRRRMREFDDG